MRLEVEVEGDIGGGRRWGRCRLNPRARWQMAVGRLEGWEVGRLGGWKVGRLGGCEVGRLAGWR